MSDDLPRMLFVHGWGGSARSWDPIRRALSWGSGSAAIDLPGHAGAAGVPTVPGAVASVLAALESDGPAILVGHSLGGQVTALAHVTRPDLVVAEVVIDPAYGHPDGDRAALQEWARAIEKAPSATVEAFVDGAFGPSTPAEVRAAVRDDLRRCDPTAFGTYLRSEYLDPDAMGLESASTAILARRSRPTLAVYSTATAAAFERRTGTADILVWRGHGHYLHLEDPARFAGDVRRWLDTMGPTASSW
ncbi:alpha/beta fold hydrolase [Occultella aeris]|uniref:2-succinyl-6-hydroxy-2, 4-cyclohexadiene-1-carboxylate synthase n=1 Tax=Occultella aeris TaxID=2761496 RepID=A0A7M4DEH8_9MICO|nr:alpha/beta hydrolase [Occultella aeris]VZO35321.1 2-succinyl-6-hydroxy-2, 4-cyclohexadiene-1-carboxylate synthase [Occultella aeris]